MQQVAVRQRETVRFQHHRHAVCRPHALNLHHTVIRQFQFALGALIRVGQLRVNQPRAGGNALHPAALVEAVDVPQVAAEFGCADERAFALLLAQNSLVRQFADGAADGHAADAIARAHLLLGRNLAFRRIHAAGHIVANARHQLAVERFGVRRDEPVRHAEFASCGIVYPFSIALFMQKSHPHSGQNMFYGVE